MPHIHLIIGIIFANILGLEQISCVFFLFGSILPDFDSMIGVLTHRNHRSLFTHYPLLWLFLSLLSGILRLEIFWLFLGGLLHLLTDILDWEVYVLRPFSDLKISILSLDPETLIEDKSIKEQLILYYKQRKIICTELIIFGIGIISILMRIG